MDTAMNGINKEVFDMNIFERFYKIIDPLSYARRKGMKVGKGVTLAGKFGTSFGSEPFLIQLDDYVRLSGG